jgi:hypothetical protein
LILNVNNNSYALGNFFTDGFPSTAVSLWEARKIIAFREKLLAEIRKQN